MKSYKVRNLIAVTITAGAIAGNILGVNAEAAPRKYSQCNVINQIQSPPNSAGFFMSEDCKTAYVLPPASGAVQMMSYVDEIGAGAELCSAVNGTIREMDIKKKDAAKELTKVEGRMTSIAKELAQNKSKCLEIDHTASSAQAKLASNQTAQSAISAKIQKIDSDLPTCVAAQCDDLNTERMVLSDQLDYLKMSEESLAERSSKLSEKQNSCHADQARIDQVLTAENSLHQSRVSTLKASLVSLTTATNSLFETQRSIPGAMMSVMISSEQTDLVKKFREMNQDLKNVQFIEMPLSDVQLSFTQIKDGEASGYPTLLKANINGVTVGADHSMTSVPFEENSSSREVAFGAAVGGSITINRFAACQLPAASEYGRSTVASQRRVKDIAGLLAGTATYRYQLAVSRKINIHYNEKQLYCLIKKHSSSSGLFRSSSATSITEKSELNQWLTIDANSEDDGFDFANRETLVMDLRAELLDRALMKVASSYLSRERAQLIDPEAPRADGMANTLRKCPNLYCQAAAIGLNLGSALFGGTSSSSSTCEDVGASSTQQLIDTKPVSAYGTQAFRIKAGGRE